MAFQNCFSWRERGLGCTLTSVGYWLWATFWEGRSLWWGVRGVGEGGYAQWRAKLWGISSPYSQQLGMVFWPQGRTFLEHHGINWAFPGGIEVKNPPASAGDTRGVGLIPGLVRPPGGGNGNPLQYSCLKNSTDRGAWWSTVHGWGWGWGHKQSNTTKYNTQTWYQLQSPLVLPGPTFLL